MISFKTRVRYGETDQMGIVYYGNYLNWFEMGRTEFCRSLGRDYTVWEKEGVFLPVVEAHCRYKRSLFYDDVITIWTWPEKLTRASVMFCNKIVRDADGKTAAEGWTKHAFVDGSGKIIKGENALAKWLEESGHIV